MNLDDQILDVLAELRNIELIKGRLDELNRHIKQQKVELRKLEAILEKEYRDFKRLDEDSIQNYIYGLFVDRKAKIEKEQQEYIKAFLAVENTKKQIIRSEKERDLFEDILLEEQEHEKKLKSRLEALLNEREKELDTLKPTTRKAILQINTKLAQETRILKELDQAIFTGQKFQATLTRIIDHFKGLGNIGSWLSGNNANQGKSWVSSAIDLFWKAKDQIRKFETELNNLSKKVHFDLKEERKSIESFIESVRNPFGPELALIIYTFQIGAQTQKSKNEINQILKQLIIEQKRTAKDIDILKDQKRKILLENYR